MEVSNKLYVHNIKEILAEPARRFPVTYNRVEQTQSTQLYSTRLTCQEKRKDSKDMQGYLACGFIASTGALLSVRPYIKFY